MPRSTNQKLKLYYLYRVLLEKTDDTHTITMPEIQQYLGSHGITADRKSLYSDIDALRTLGFDVIGEKDGRNFCYHLGSKEFEVAELKLLVDAIQSQSLSRRKSPMIL